ncbi:SRPBCC family protein [Streptomyces sp. NBC_01808]|uniref:SRPBCC family protein n=1 Tax=Streptomyces sp. NBC_01808 TaxID=2975947 RepID=UPI002DD9F290|nr:SRPBCC family protein [Streptomyces sp. NBC_01808]WSA39323.1 SRPBCC family protein [Streptomyces sp. NBC_01808]
MEREVHVPQPAETVRRALSDAERVARSVPGLTPDEDGAEEPGTLRGRLRLRVAGSSITYRGTLRLTPGGPSVAVEAEGEESRGSGSVTASLTLTPREAVEEGTTTLLCTGTVTSTGRLAAVEAAQAEAAGVRLLERFVESLAADLEAEPLAEGSPEPGGEPEHPDDAVQPGDGTDVGLGDDNERAIPGIPAPEQSGETPPGTGKVFDAEVPPPSLDPLADDVLDALADEDEDADEPGDGMLEEPEAAHARRTMIGRSAEEVDHAPPRGRYAPTPAADAPVQAAGLRWLAPAAALAVATAVILSRALRRRH